MPLEYRPLAVAALVGGIDGIINPSGGKEVIPHGHALYRGAVLALGVYGASGQRPSKVAAPPSYPGRWDPNIAQGMIVSAAALLGSTLPAALTGGGFAALGDVEQAYGGGARGHSNATRKARRRGGDPNCQTCGGDA